MRLNTTTKKIGHSMCGVFLLGFGFFASVTGVFCYSGLVRGFFATVGVGVFLRQWKGFWLRQGGFFASVVVFCDGNRGLLHRRRSTAERGLVRGFFATVGVGVFLRQWKGFWLRQGGFFASVVVFCDGNPGLLHWRRSTAERGLVRGFFATVGVGVFLRQWKGFWLWQGGFFASVVVFCDGNRGLLHWRRSTAERSIKKTSSWATVKQ